MKTKAISLTLASLMSIQSVGFAQQDRTANIGNQAISAAQSNLKALNKDILLLDQSLSDAQAAIEKRDSRGGITNGAAVAGAGIGLAMTAMAYLMLNSRTEGSGLGAMALGVVSAGATIASLAAGAGSQALKMKVDTQKLDSELAQAKKNAEAALAQTNDYGLTGALTQVGLRIQNTQEALASYKDQESDVSRNRLVSQATQLVGATLLMYGILRDSSKSVNIGTIGAIVMSSGNLGAAISGFQGSEAKEVLKHIKYTREALRAASATLN